MKRAVPPDRYARLVTTRLTKIESQRSPTATGQLCVSSQRSGVTKMNLRLTLNWPYGTSFRAQLLRPGKYAGGLCRTAYVWLLTRWQLEGIASWKAHQSPPS